MDWNTKDFFLFMYDFSLAIRTPTGRKTHAEKDLYDLLVKFLRRL